MKDVPQTGLEGRVSFIDKDSTQVILGSIFSFLFSSFFGSDDAESRIIMGLFNSANSQR
jgi:hypothetical protein